MKRHPINKHWVRGPFYGLKEGTIVICVEDSKYSLYDVGKTWVVTRYGEIKSEGIVFSGDCGWFVIAGEEEMDVEEFI